MSRLHRAALAKEIEIKFLPDGTVYSSWWAPEVAVIICVLCGRGGGFYEFGPAAGDDFKRKEALGPCYMCSTRNPYCG